MRTSSTVTTRMSTRCREPRLSTLCSSVAVRPKKVCLPVCSTVACTWHSTACCSGCRAHACKASPHSHETCVPCVSYVSEQLNDVANAWTWFMNLPDTCRGSDQEPKAPFTLLRSAPFLGTEEGLGTELMSSVPNLRENVPKSANPAGT